MIFLSEPEPPRRAALEVVSGIRRIVASNPGVMTYHGTNTYLIDGEGGVIVLDPGPDDDEHVRAILSATTGRIKSILLSHTHADHLGATAALKARTGATTYGFHISADPAFVPDIPLRHGDKVAGMIAIHTPGHASDHLCFARPDGIVFSADHVMAWSSSVVGPPGGNMADYFESLKLMLNRDDRLYLPGHGPQLSEPKPFVVELFNHRLDREAGILAAINEKPAGTWELVDRLYPQMNARLRQAAERSVTAHLIKLSEEGLVELDGEVWRSRAAQ